MLTGDNEQTARRIAAEAGIAEFRAEVLPQQKSEYIKQLQAEGKHVAMVGDGINDSAALAQADLSIAMGQGSDIAMDVAKMTIISSDLTKIMRGHPAFDTHRTYHSRELILGIYLQPDRNSRSGRGALPFHGILAEPDDCGSCHGVQFGFGGNKQPPTENEANQIVL